jgi:YVTN family beta-propeller protein
MLLPATPAKAGYKTGVAAVLVFALLAIPSLPAIDWSGVHSPIGRSDHPAPAPPVPSSPEKTQLDRHRLETTPLIGAHGPAGLPPTSAAWVAFAPWDQSFYVAVPPSSLDVIPSGNGSTTVVAVGSQPFGVAVDITARLVFVTNSGSGNVSVINGSTQKVVKNISVQEDPEGIAYDAINNTVYVADNRTGSISVISVASLSVITTVRVGSDPIGVAWDEATNKIFVADWGSNSTSVISEAAGRNQVSVNLSVGIRPYGVAIDNDTDTVYVSNQQSNNVSEIFASNDTLGQAIPVAFGYGIMLEGIVYDPAHHAIWVAGGSSFVVVINTSRALVVDYVDIDPSGAVYDSTNGKVCVTNAANVTFACFVYGITANYPSGIATFYETGLPAGTLWSVTLCQCYALFPVWSNLTQYSTTTAIQFGVYQGMWKPYYYNLTYSIWSSSMVPQPAQGYDVAPVGGSTNVSITFVVDAPKYSVVFNESGLPSGTSWSATLRSSTLTSTSTSITFFEYNGTGYPYSIERVVGYVASPGYGSVSVKGFTTQVDVKFTLSPNYYSVEFHETGLLSGWAWSITLDGGVHTSGTGSVIFVEMNGTYPYIVGLVSNYTATPSSGNVSVLGAGVSVAINFTNSNVSNSLQILSFVLNPSSVVVGSMTHVLVRTSGGSGTLHYSYSGFPAGCTPLDSDAWSCTPTTVGTSSVSVRVTDPSGNGVSATTVLTVSLSAGPGSRLAEFSGVAIGVGLTSVLLVAAAVVLAVRRRISSASLETTPIEDPYYSAASMFRSTLSGANHGDPQKPRDKNGNPSSNSREPQADDPLSGFV